MLKNSAFRLRLCWMAALITMFSSLPAWAEEPAPQDSGQLIREGIAKVAPGMVVDQVNTTEVNGLYEVVVGPMGSKIYYATADGRYLVTGDIIDLNTRISLTQSRAQELEMAYNDDRLKVLDTLGDDNMIAFGPDDAQDTVTVITDVNCGYCRKLHREMDQYNTEGIRVRYVLTDLFGGKDSRQKAEAVWCAEDRKDALTKVKNREAIEMLTCEAPLDQQIAVGTEFGVTGTPAIVLPDGQLIRGYKPAKDLKALLDMKRLAQESLASEMNGKPTEQPGSVQ